MKFKQLAKDVLSKMHCRYDTMQILHELDSRINFPMKIGSKSESKNNRKNPSGYIINEIDRIKHLYTSLRVCDHLPKLSNYVLNPEIPSDKQFAHICMMFLGYKTWLTFGSEKGNITMGDKRETVKIKVDHQMYEYYKSELPKNIPYHIYHFIPEFLTENDLSLLATAADNWLVAKGDAEFVVPVGLTQNVYYHEHSKSGVSSIDCTMRIVKASVNENVYLVSGQDPVMTFDIGYVTLVSPEGKELTLHGYLDIEKCDDVSFEIFCALNNRSESASRKKKKKLSEDVKREIYYDVMEQMSRMVKEELDML